MTQFKFAGCVHDSHGYVDCDINTDNPNEYWVLSYDRETRHWYALQRIADDDEGPFDDGETATPQEVAQMLAAMPVNQLPVEIYI